jgi:sugar phosphate isomerase/epimerase
MNRRQTFKAILGSSSLLPLLSGKQDPCFKIEYVLSSALFGNLPLADVLPEVNKAGASGIDIWRKVHATHREQIQEMGDDTFQSLLAKNKTRMLVSTCYPLGSFGQDEELAWVKKNGGKMTVSAARAMGEKDSSGKEASRQVKLFFEKLKPHLEIAQSLGVKMVFENHGNALLHTPDSLRYFAEYNPDTKHVGIGFAPHHMQNFGDAMVSQMIGELGGEQIPFIYFQEHGIGSKKHVDKETELEQLPGRGNLDYVPVVQALKKAGFTGIAEIFMHPTPRGVPMLPTAPAITAEVNKSRAYIETCLAKA